MFDPLKDFETSDFLRNKFAEKDPQIVEELEDQMFRASLDEAITHLARRRGALRYEDFLAVHRILFEGLCPWAGQDRAATAPEIAVTQAGSDNWRSHENFRTQPVEIERRAHDGSGGIARIYAGFRRCACNRCSAARSDCKFRDAVSLCRTLTQ